MKKEIKLSKIYYWILSALVVFGMASCKKENSMGFTPGTGAPTVTSVQTVYKSKMDTVTQYNTTYSSSGVITVDTVINTAHQTVTAFDSTTVTGNLGNLYVVNGTNLGATTKLAINGVNVYFNRGLISDHSIIFTIPTNIPYVQPQPNTLVITTLYGTATYKFTVLPPPPTITAVSDFDFFSSSQITLTGKGFASVSAVKLRATNDPLTVVSQNDSTLVLQFPATTAATESTLLFTYTSGSNANAQTASTATFDDLDNAYTIFYKSSFQNSWGDNSWSGPSGAQTGTPHAYSGTKSLEATYPAGAWQIEGWANWYPSIAYDPSYKYLSFWVKGGVAKHTLVLVGNQMAGGYGQVQNANAYTAQLITVPPGVWTYFKIPLSPTQASTNPNFLAFWNNGSPAAEMGFFLQGMSGDVNETMYFDEVAFIK
ncbi:MAG TPA: hypothetical protein VFE53_00155 [Mucilaginibacter sp.]|jgi:hypothetical protein|nr:hypothetical protein [Mucilaginibacter sp.]